MGHEIRRVCLPKVCDTAYAASLHEELARDLSSLGEVQIDAGAVERINTPAIQLLVALGRALGTEHIPMSVEACSPAFETGFEHLGLLAQLTEWRAA